MWGPNASVFAEYLDEKFGWTGQEGFLIFQIERK
jgi:hypothetical protein